MIIGPEYFSFLRINSRKETDIYLQNKVDEHFDQALDQFLKDVKNGKHYFGQDVVLLITEPVAFTLIRSHENTNLEDFREECRKLIPETTQQEFRLINIAGKGYYTVFRIDEEYVKSSLKIIDKHDILINQVMPLSGLIINEFQNSNNLKLQNCEFKLGIYRCAFGFDPNKPFYLESIKDNNLLQSLCPEVETEIKSVFNNPLPPVVKNAFALTNLIPKSVQYLLIGTGSSRLMTSIVAVLLICFTILAGVFAVLKNNAEDSYNQYQNSLAEISSVESQIHKVERELESYDQGVLLHANFSAHLSTFCQRIPSGLQAIELKAERKDRGEITVTAHGKTRRETSVFRYRDYVYANSGNRPVEISSISRLNSPYNMPDSIWYRFTITMN
ncbi:MAG: hypothetical protein V3V99_01905 [candidate division Zixibacteria bacterium]